MSLINSTINSSDHFNLIAGCLRYSDHIEMSCVCRYWRIAVLPAKYESLLAEIEAIRRFQGDVKEWKRTQTTRLTRLVTETNLQQSFIRKITALMLSLLHKHGEKTLDSKLPIFCQIVMANDQQMRQQVQLSQQIVNNFISTLMPTFGFVEDGIVNLSNLCIYGEPISHQNSQGSEDSQDTIEAYGLKEPINDKHLKSILKVLTAYKPSEISILDLRGNNFTSEGLPLITQFCVQKKVQVLLLSDNPIGDEGMLHLIEFVKEKSDCSAIAVQNSGETKTHFKALEAAAKCNNIQILSEERIIDNLITKFSKSRVIK